MTNRATRVQSKSAQNQSSSSARNALAPFIAIVALLGFGVFTVYLVLLSTTQEPEWTRDIYLYGGIEAIAFSAAGFLFGSEVRRRQAEAAEERASEAEAIVISKTAEAASVAASGRALADAIDSKIAMHNQATQSSTLPASSGSNGGANATNEPPMDLLELAHLAHQLFESSSGQ